MKNNSWKKYAEYAKSNPEMNLTELAEHFCTTPGNLSLVLSRHGIRVRDGRKKNTIMGVPSQDFIDYAKEHTVREISEHFNKKPSNVSSTLSYNRIEHIKVIPKTKTNEEYKYKIKRTGEAHDMIRTLAETYSYSAIARVFGYSKERIRQIVNEK